MHDRIMHVRWAMVQSLQGEASQLITGQIPSESKGQQATQAEGSRGG